MTATETQYRLKDIAGQTIEHGSIVAYCVSNRSRAMMKYGIVLSTKVKPRRCHSWRTLDVPPDVSLSLISAERYGHEWRIMNNSAPVSLPGADRVLVVDGSQVPDVVRDMLKNAVVAREASKRKKSKDEDHQA